MLTLALDTSTRTGSIALGDGREVLAERALQVRANQSETVLPAIADLLRLQGRRPAELQAVVVGSGPGSFTGVRIAASLAKGIAFATGARLFAYSSLTALAAGSGHTGRVCAVIDARRGQVYAAGYEVSPGGVQQMFAPVAVPVRELPSLIRPPAAWVLAGLVPAGVEEIVRGAGARRLPGPVAAPNAASLLWLSRVMPERGHIEVPATWEPEYVRLPAAQRASTT